MYPANKFSTNSGFVVESARHAREERAHLRRRETAAVTIQSATRGFLSRLALGKKWRNELDLMIGRDPNQDEDRNKTREKKQENVNGISVSQTSALLDKISLQSKQRSEEEWTFASFGSNTLIGAYGNLSNTEKVETPNTKASQDSSNALEKQSKPVSYMSLPTETISNENVQSPTVKVLPNIQKQNCSSPSIKQAASKKSTNQEIFKMIQQFLYILKDKKDRHRFTDLIKYLLLNINNESSPKALQDSYQQLQQSSMHFIPNLSSSRFSSALYSYVALCVHKQFALSWITQVKQVLWRCCRYLDTIQDSNDGQSVTVLLRILIALTDISQWKALQKQTALHGALAQICTNISRDLYARGCACVVGYLLKEGVVSALTSSSIAACMALSFRLLSCQDYNDDSINSFMLTLLTVPSLLWQVREKAPQCLSLFKQRDLLSRILTLFHVEDALTRCSLIPRTCGSYKAVTDVLCVFANLVQFYIIEYEVMEKKQTEAVALLNQCLKFLSDSATRLKSSSTSWHPVLGYFAGNELTSKQAEAMPYVKRQLEFLWEQKFVCVAFHDVLTLPSLHNDEATPVQAEQITSKMKSKTKLSDKFSSYLKKIASSRSQRIVLPTGGRKLEYAEVKNTCCSCLLYRRVLSIVTKQLQLEMLTGLTFMNEVMCRMWRFICELGPSGGLNLFLNSLTLPADVAEPYFAVFTLFCDMTSHILSILDDVEFYEQQIPFHLEELVTISASLRQFVFKVIWNGIVKDSRSPMFPVFDSAHTLLMMLYDRDARRPFTPSNHWLCKTVKSSAIRSEVEKSNPRAILVLAKIPFVLPHKDRVILFRSFVNADKAALGISPENEIAAHIRVHRSRLVEDGFTQLSAISPSSIKGVIRVKFVNDLGLDEAGIDQDGVFKEFLEEIIQKVFNPDMNLFKVTTGGESKLYPSPLSHLQDDHITLFTFVGRMLGKAVYEGIVLDIPFANFFLRNLLAQQHTMLYSPIDELPSLDAEFYKNLTWIKRYDGDISDLGLTFTFEEDIMGRVESHELIPGGSAIAVTNENRIMYIHTLAHYRMNTQIRKQTKAFVSGFRSIVAHSWTAMFSAPELQRLISGDNVDMDLSDLKKYVVYYGGFHASHRVVKWLWDILERDYSAQDRSGFLKFVTSCSRPPLLGFAHLNPQFSIRCVEVPDDEDTGDTMATVLRGFLRLPSTKMKKSQHHPHRLPTASTCFNLLKLPNYPSKDVLREKLKQAISNNTGFELS